MEPWSEHQFNTNSRNRGAGGVCRIASTTSFTNEGGSAHLPKDWLGIATLTNTPVAKSSARSGLAVAAFLALVFVGDVWLIKLTLPLSMLILPAIFVVFRPYELRSFPIGMFLLLGIACLQVASGMSMHVKADLAMWAAHGLRRGHDLLFEFGLSSGRSIEVGNLRGWHRYGRDHAGHDPVCSS